MPLTFRSVQVGIIQPTDNIDSQCLVEWAGGKKDRYDIGRSDRFELVHLEVSPTSGAPVVGSYYPDQRGLRRGSSAWRGGGTAG